MQTKEVVYLAIGVGEQLNATIYSTAAGAEGGCRAREKNEPGKQLRVVSYYVLPTAVPSRTAVEEPDN